MGSPSEKYATQGFAATGLGFGIAGAVLGLLNNNGFLGNLINGCNNNATVANLEYISKLQAENANLKANNYSDKNSKEVYDQTIANDNAIKSEFYAFVKPLAEESAQNRVNIAVLQEQAKCNQEKAELREQIIIGKINELGLATNGKFDSLNNVINCISGKVGENTARIDNITKEVIPMNAICPSVMPRYNSFECPSTTETTTPKK